MIYLEFFANVCLLVFRYFPRGNKSKLCFNKSFFNGFLRISWKTIVFGIFQNSVQQIKDTAFPLQTRTFSFHNLINDNDLQSHKF